MARKAELKNKQSKLKSKNYIKLEYPSSPQSCKTAVMLVNFGGPIGYENVKPFLYNLFCDPVILNFKYAQFFRKPLAWFISNMRDFNSRFMYKKVNGVSPLIPITYLQGEKLQQELNLNKIPFDVFISFRYTNPNIIETLNNIKKLNYKKIIILPLFPQYSYTTTGSIQLLLDDWIKNNKQKTEIIFIKDWYKDPDYIQAYTKYIENSLKHCDLDSTELIFSAHSIPYINIENGDPYEEQIKETVSLIIEKLKFKKKFHIAYQSKVGPVKWLEPSTDKVIEEIASRNKNVNILIIPISFTCEHVETIYEIGVLYKDLARKHGINNFKRVPALNLNKYLIKALYNQTLQCLENN